MKYCDCGNHSKSFQMIHNFKNASWKPCELYLVHALLAEKQEVSEWHSVLFTLSE